MTTLIGNDNSNFQSLLFPSVNAFMDDLFLMCCSARDSSPFGSCIALSLARISVNRFKSRNFVFEKRRILNENVLSVVINKNKYSIPPISEKSVKFLGRTISGSQSQIDNLSLSVNTGLVLINKSKHRPVQKLWILQHPFLPLLIYEILLTVLVKLEQKICNSICCACIILPL